jgi:hypothetical protein
MDTPQPIYATVDGKQFQVFVGADNRFYLHDPHNRLAFEHMALPGGDEMPGNGLHGLGAGEAAYGQVAATALSFVPVVGPILGPIAGAVASLFGGGDPTPADSIWASLIGQREMAAQLRNQIAGQVVDTFVVPPGLDRTSDGPNGGNTGNVLATKITSEVLGLGTDDIHKVKRAQWYSALSALQKLNADLQAKLHDMQLTQSIVAQMTPAPSPIPATSLTQPTLVQPSTVNANPVPITQDQLTAAYQQGAMEAAKAATQYQLPMLAQTSLPSAYPAVYTQTTPATVATTDSGVNQMLPYIAIGGMMLVALLANRS